MQRGTQVHPVGKAVVQKGYREILKEEIKKCVAKKLKRMAACLLYTSDAADE